MDEAKETWALVVGIDRYDELQPLGGAVADALTAVSWLQRVGVPDKQILLHTAPRTKVGTLRSKGARKDDIWSSINKLDKSAGKRLFVLLFGHALYEATSKRLYCTQDFGRNGDWSKNLSIDLYRDLFLSMPYRRQFLVLDGCQNLPTPPEARPLIPAGPPGRANVTPKEENSMVACFSASVGEVASESANRGLFSRWLFEGLDPDDPLLDAVDLDWGSGTRSMNIRTLLDHVRSTVRDAAANQHPSVQQTPDIETVGAVHADREQVFRFPVTESAEITLGVAPDGAVAGVDRLEIQVDDRPYWGVREPKPGFAAEIHVPLTVRLPRGLRTRITCHPKAGWSAHTPTLSLTAGSMQHEFTVEPEHMAPPTVDMTGASAVYRLAVVDVNGVNQAFLNYNHYDKLARSVGLGDAPDWDAEVAPGVAVRRHETGPELVVLGYAEPLDVGGLANDWATALGAATPDDISVVTELHLVDNQLPNVRIAAPAGDWSTLAGPIAPIVRLSVGAAAGETGDAQFLSLVRAEAGVRMTPGPVRISLDLPWGSWTDVVEAPIVGERIVEAPASVGLPPLRVSLYGSEPPSNHVRVISRDPGTPAISNGFVAGSVAPGAFEEVALDAVKAQDAWDIDLVTSPWTAGTRIKVASVGSDARISFPVVPFRAFAADLTPERVRIEPFSRVQTPEWDLLVASGRLDDLSGVDRDALAHAKWEDPLIGVASAYALFAAEAWADLRVVLRNLGNILQPTVPDVDILEALRAHRSEDGVPEHSVKAIESIAARGEIPVFRWGIGAALDAIALSHPDKALDGLRTTLTEINKSLCLSSIWTAWKREEI